MFVRKKKNKSGTTSVVVLDKHGGKFKELHTVDIARNEMELDEDVNLSKMYRYLDKLYTVRMRPFVAIKTGIIV